VFVAGAGLAERAGRYLDRRQVLTLTPLIACSAATMALAFPSAPVVALLAACTIGATSGAPVCRNHGSYRRAAERAGTRERLRGDARQRELLRTYDI
jgi:hypothetical protein